MIKGVWTKNNGIKVYCSSNGKGLASCHHSQTDSNLSKMFRWDLWDALVTSSNGGIRQIVHKSLISVYTNANTLPKQIQIHFQDKYKVILFHSSNSWSDQLCTNISLQQLLRQIQLQRKREHKHKFVFPTFIYIL